MTDLMLTGAFASALYFVIYYAIAMAHDAAILKFNLSDRGRQIASALRGAAMSATALYFVFCLGIYAQKFHSIP